MIVDSLKEIILSAINNPAVESIEVKYEKIEVSQTTTFPTYELRPNIKIVKYAR